LTTRCGRPTIASKTRSRDHLRELTDETKKPDVMPARKTAVGTVIVRVSGVKAFLQRNRINSSQER